MEAYDSTFDNLRNGWQTNMLRYAIYSNVTGTWALEGYSDADCGDFNAAWDGVMTFTYADWGTLADGNYGFRVAPVYKWTDYENTPASIYIPRGRGPILNVPKVASAAEVRSDIPLVTGWNLISLDVKNGTIGYLNASDFVVGIDDSAFCLFMATWDGDGYAAYDVVGDSGDFQMDVGYGYWVYMTANSTARIWGYNKTTQLDLVGPESYSLTPNKWNLVGWFNETQISASDYCLLVGDSGATPSGYVTPWDPSGQEYVDGFLIFPAPVGPQNDFNMQPKYGYWIWVQTVNEVIY
ncbi:MAG: hypothetical protein QCI38_07600, partial [Candidatus Thermoplasmatota archaeon]|nr:hypothetical protein [Candidatus Thermoplasmatota archaeon]